MTHVSQSQLVTLAGELSSRRWQLLRAVASVRLASGKQLRSLFYDREQSAAAARLARLDLAALHQLGVLHRLERQVGGARAGSSGFVYAIGPVGVRLLALDAGKGAERHRSRYEPSVGFVEHALAVTQVWVDLHEHVRGPWTERKQTKLDYRVERAAWREYRDSFGTPVVLKPDAELRVQGPEFQDHWWIEVDRATERRAALARQLKAYVAYYASGREQCKHGVFPLTAWLTTTEQRAAVLSQVIGTLPRREQQLFRVGLLSAASPFLLSEGRGTA